MYRDEHGYLPDLSKKVARKVKEENVEEVVEEDGAVVRVVANLPQWVHRKVKVRLRDGFGSVNNYINALIENDLKNLEAERAIAECEDEMGKMNALSFVLKVDFYDRRWHINVVSAAPYRHFGGFGNV